MSKRESISRYNLIIKKLRKHPSSFNEISDYLAFESELQEYNFVVSKRTFQRDLEDIRSLYNIDIQYDFSRKVYFVDFDEQPDVNERILEAFDTFNALNLTDRLSNHIHFEKRRPQGTENLYGLLHAIKNRFQIKFSYQKYWEDLPEIREVEPHALKEFKNRWYLLAVNTNDGKTRIFALDRMLGLMITNLKFQHDTKIGVNDFFQHCFGIIAPEEQLVEEVILSFEPFQGKYIKSLPLHETQEILVDNDKEVRVKLKVYVTVDFIMEVLSYGRTVKVIQPQNLIEELQEIYRLALQQYEDKSN